MGRDHLTTARAGNGLLMTANVHFEQNSTLRELHVRLRATCAHWPVCPAGLGVLFGALNTCDPEEVHSKEKFQTFFWWRSRSHLGLPSYLTAGLGDCAAQLLKERRPQDGGIRTLSRIGRAFINIPMVEAREFRCRAHTVDDLGDRLLPDDHTASRTAIQEPASGAQELATIQAWLSKRAVFCSALSVHKARGRAPLRCIADHLDNAWR